MQGKLLLNLLRWLILLIALALIAGDTQTHTAGRAAQGRTAFLNDQKWVCER
jgi:hypothetical protein